MRDLKVYRAGRAVPVNAGIRLTDPELIAVGFDEADAQNSLYFHETVVGAVVLERVDQAAYGDLIRSDAGLKKGVYVIGQLDGRLVSFRYRPEAVRPEQYAVASNG